MLNSPLIHHLGQTLIHSLWQGAIVALLLALASMLLGPASAQKRYLAACCALLLQTGLSVVTFFLLSSAPKSAPENIDSLSTVQIAPGSSELAQAENRNILLAAPIRLAEGVSRSGSHLLQRISPWAGLFWLVGLSGVSIWNLGGWIAAKRLGAIATDMGTETEIFLIFTRMLRRLEINQPVRLLRSCHVLTPIVIGALKPAILVPAGLLTHHSARYSPAFGALARLRL